MSSTQPTPDTLKETSCPTPLTANQRAAKDAEDLDDDLRRLRDTDGGLGIGEQVYDMVEALQLGAADPMALAKILPDPRVEKYCRKIAAAREFYEGLLAKLAREAIDAAYVEIERVFE